MTSDETTGWTFRGNYDAHRIEELRISYEDLGFTVKLGPMVREAEGACTACTESCRLQALYTKKIDSQ